MLIANYAQENLNCFFPCKSTTSFYEIWGQLFIFGHKNDIKTHLILWVFSVCWAFIVLKISTHYNQTKGNSFYSFSETIEGIVFILSLWLELITQCTEVGFASFLSGWFITAIVVIPQERKVANFLSKLF